MYESQSISNASNFFFSFNFQENSNKITQLENHNIDDYFSLLNIISVHFHRFGPPFNKGMYSSPVKSSRRPACHSALRQPTLFFLQLLYSDEPLSNSADIHCCIPILIFQHFMYANGHFTFCSQEFNHRTLQNTGWNTCPC